MLLFMLCVRVCAHRTLQHSNVSENNVCVKNEIILTDPDTHTDAHLDAQHAQHIRSPATRLINGYLIYHTAERFNNVVGNSHTNNT